MSHFHLRCTSCEAAHVADMTTLHCDKCRSPLEVWYEDSPDMQSGPQPYYWTGPHIPLPIHGPGSLLSLGEGNTPCIELPALATLLGLKRLLAKLEFLSPTGSFKDRGTAVMMSAASEHGVTQIAEDSSGNAGASVAAYAAMLGIAAHIFAPASAPAVKLHQIGVYGAIAHLIEGPREASAEAAIDWCTEHGTVYASHNLSPYFVEGTKMFAYEVALQSGDAMPDHIVTPVGNGSLYLGMWKGFGELLEQGQVVKVPRLHCVQARAVMPIVAAYEGDDWSAHEVANTVAGGIAVASPPRKQQVLRVLEASGGVAVAVGEGAILRWQALLAESAGLYAEPTSAAAFAGLDALITQGVIQPSESVLLPLTGSGLKDPMLT